MKKLISIVLVIIFCFTFININKTRVKASSYTSLKSVSVARKNILIPKAETLTIEFEDNSLVKDVDVKYKSPDGDSVDLKAGRNPQDSFSTASIMSGYSTEGLWKIDSLEVNYIDGSFNLLNNVVGGDFTTFSKDLVGPIFNTISASNINILAGGDEVITVNAEDELTDVAQITAKYKLPNNTTTTIDFVSIGNNQYQAVVPAGVSSILGKYQCMSITMGDTSGNTTSLADLRYPTTSTTPVNLILGDFNVKAELDGPTLTSISVDKPSAFKWETETITVVAHDTSGVAQVTVNYQPTYGISRSFILNRVSSTAGSSIFRVQIKPSDYPDMVSPYASWNVSSIYMKDTEGNGTNVLKNLATGNFVVVTSNLCDVTSVATPTSSKIDQANKNITTSTFSSSVVSSTVDVSVSTDAAWKLYSDFGCSKEITNKVMKLSGGANVAYIKVTALNGITTKIYAITINKLEVTDVNQDGTVDITDLAAVSAAYNSKIGDKLYKANLDFNRDNIIDIFDLVLLSKDM